LQKQKAETEYAVLVLFFLYNGSFFYCMLNFWMNLWKRVAVPELGTGYMGFVQAS